ncbi:Uncharacterized protein ESCO_005464 [Escovopsis weberi]|uniref:CFEM domain-containing protein n=1 Tax=Escovopsis weberi TaxID=150374 RepID=A0A0M9VUX9_ESCWE|nr:Uncharacterized protein ESCO_005464 [Escovopsis weberi]
MKTFVLALSALAAVVAAQSTDNLAPCSAQELGCQSGDLQCLCTNQNFFFGLRDCSSEICSEGDARSTVDFGIQMCRGVGVAITTGGGNGGSEASSSASGTSAPTATSAAEGKGTVSTFTTTATSSGTVNTFTVTTTISGDYRDLGCF